MNSTNASLLVTITGFLVLNLAATVLGGSDCVNATCQGQPVSMDKFNASLTTCLTEMKDTLKLIQTPKDANKLFKNYCFVACLWEKLGIVSNGAANTAGIATYIGSSYPAPFRAALIDGTSNCAKMSGTGLVKTDECKSYKPFSKCFLKAIKTVCKVPGGVMATGAPTATGRRRREAPAAQKPTPAPAKSGPDDYSSEESTEDK